MNKYDIAIIGGGAAGCMAAISAGSNSRSVVLIERNDKLGKKILATGNGRCNITNLDANSSRYHGASPEFIDKILKSFDQYKAMEFFETHGLIFKEEDNGRIFPRNDQASSVVELLEQKLRNNKVDIKTNSLVRKIEKNGSWKIKLEDGEEITACKLIITTGGQAAYQFGSSGDGYYWSEKLGHKIIKTHPALVPIDIKEEWIKGVQGIKVVCKASTIIDNKVIFGKTGDVLFTHFGISGPAAMAQARFVNTAVSSKQVRIKLDFFPDLNTNQLDEKLRKIFESNGAKLVKNCLVDVVPLKLLETILDNLNIDQNKKSAELSKKDRIIIVNYLKNIVLTPTGPRPFKEAQVTAGGIDSSEIDAKTMESKLVPTLYFAGEIIDVDGDSGGFNLQWAWSSGHLAGISASK